MKSKGTKGKRVKKKKAVPAETKKVEKDIDILNMVREINLDNLGLSTNFESSNGHENSLSKKLQKDPECATIKKRKAEEVTLVPVPKRKRSSIAHGKSRSSSTPRKAPPRVSGEDSSGAKLLLGAEFNRDTGSKTKQRKKVKGNEPSIEEKIKASKSYHDNDADKSEEHDMKVKSYCQADLYISILNLIFQCSRLLIFCLLQSPDNSKPTSKSKSGNFKSSTGSAKKQKRKSIGGLAKVNFSTVFVVNVVVVFMQVASPCHVIMFGLQQISWIIV